MMFGRRRRSVARFFAGQMNAPDRQAFLLSVKSDPGLQHEFSAEQRIQQALERDRDMVPSADDLPSGLARKLEATPVPVGVVPTLMPDDVPTRSRALRAMISVICIVGVAVLLWWLLTAVPFGSSGRHDTVGGSRPASGGNGTRAGVVDANPVRLLDAMLAIGRDGVPSALVVQHSDTALGARARSPEPDTVGMQAGSSVGSGVRYPGRTRERGHNGSDGRSDGERLRDYLNMKERNSKSRKVEADSTVHMRIKR
ncbi:MAG: hypothetical protein JST22_06440 [Bacteroidetes bacterium]|nr:hypothetical protein [Bacteroidota bacterium]